MQPSLRSIAKTSTKAETRKNHPRSGLKSQQAIALSTIHRAIPRLPRISKDLEYSFSARGDSIILFKKRLAENKKEHAVA
jgi:hypothetical protein